MKLFNTLFLLVCATSLFYGCQKDTSDTPEPEIETAGNINLLSPEIGQKSKYVLFRGFDIKDNNNYDFEYLPDTLSAEVVSADENGWLIKENLTPGSASLNGEHNVAFADSTWYYYIYVEDQALKIKQRGNYYRTRLFFLEDNSERGLSLLRIASPATTLNGWKTMLPFDKNYQAAMTTDYEQFGTKYAHLNIIIDNRLMTENLPGNTHIFSLEEGLIRSMEYSDFDGRGYGWDAL